MISEDVRNFAHHLRPYQETMCFGAGQVNQLMQSSTGRVDKAETGDGNYTYKTEDF